MFLVRTPTCLIWKDSITPLEYGAVVGIREGNSDGNEIGITAINIKNEIEAITLS